MTTNFNFNCLYQHSELMKYLSPGKEYSIWKDIPIDSIDDVQNFLSMFASLPPGKRFYYRYRGPRRPGIIGSQTCLKKDATRFSVYVGNK